MTNGLLYSSHASYMDPAFGDLADIADNMLNAFDTFDTHPKCYGALNFDTIVGTGLSGTLVVPYLGRAFGLHWAIVRKSDGSHSSNMIEGEIGQSWLFVDDFICSGNTLIRVKEIVSRYCRSEYAGMYEYYHKRFR